MRNQYDILKTEVGVLTLLPAKTKEAVTNIIPDVARELDKIQKEYTKSLHDSIILLSVVMRRKYRNIKQK